LKGRAVTAIGYGRVAPFDASSIGRRASVSLDVDAICGRIFRVGNDLKNVCFGDSGGALLLDGALVGLVSSGRDGCNTPSTVTRIDAHLPWLTRTIAGSFDAPCPECVPADPTCSAAIEVTPGAPTSGGCALSRARADARGRENSPPFAPLGAMLWTLTSCVRRRRSRRSAAHRRPVA
jgi:hypothetical protein